MPRLLLVDDNPSIHRIAESLLASTDVDLVCVDSAAEALDRLGRGEHFDVALVDTAMPGMDGWTLLGRLRGMEETARMPIALMAGVLDPVDPSKLAKAPIQGFLKKPIELRELGDRVKALLATPVASGPSPFSTVPATPAQDLVKRVEAALPEFRPEAAEVPAGLEEVDFELPDLDEDLLVLSAEDLWPEEPAQAAAEVVSVESELPDVHLELEELDLDSLQDLASEPLPPLAPMDVTPAMPLPVSDHPAEALVSEDDHLVTLSGLEELGDLDVDPHHASPEPTAELEAIAEPDHALEVLPAAALLGAGGVAAAAAMAVHHDPEPAPVVPEPVQMAEPKIDSALPAATGPALAVPGQAGGAPAVAVMSSDQARAVIQALMADPILVDALVKAVVARMGDQVLREIAWEVMPDLAGRLQR